MKIKKKLPRFNSNIKNGINEKCKLEREWKKDPDDTNIFIDFYRNVGKLMTLWIELKDLTISAAYMTTDLTSRRSMQYVMIS